MPQKSDLPPSSRTPSAQIRMPPLSGPFQMLFFVYLPSGQPWTQTTLPLSCSSVGQTSVAAVRDRALLEAPHVVLDRVLADELRP